MKTCVVVEFLLNTKLDEATAIMVMCVGSTVLPNPTQAITMIVVVDI